MGCIQTLCWDCKHAAKGDNSMCPWAAKFEPVKGWDAERLDILIQHNTCKQKKHDEESYLVYDCPLFEKG